MTPKKFLIILLIVLIVASIGISIFLIFTTPNNPQLSDKQTISLPLYRNEKYGFEVKLPASWVGYKILEKSGDIYDPNSTTTPNGILAHFPQIEIVNPLSTTAAPMQNIPIMVFTADQWQHIGNESAPNPWSVSAAPIPPTELAHNNSYVFALPARYNFAFLPGWQEVETIIASHPVTTFEPTIVK